ncbi:MAG: hypothetical protein WC755_08200, partial [Candidatus Woesearchaeota archaeon]
MVSKEILTIEISPISNFSNFEKLLMKEYNRSKRYKKIIFNFSNLTWIGPFQISLLYGWIIELHEIGKNVELRLLSNSMSSPNKAIYFLKNINFFEELIQKGINIEQRIIDTKNDKLSAFKVFNDKSELNSYLKNLSDTFLSDKLLNTSKHIDILKKGELNEILLSELGDNAFNHGEGKNVRLCICGYSEKERQESDFIASLKNNPFVEIVLSDSGKNLIKSLIDCVPPNYQPYYTQEHDDLSEKTKTILFAFEYYSTCNIEERKKRIRNLYTNSTIDPYDIATGLLYVFSFAKEYSGQLIVKCDDEIVSIDFSHSKETIIKSIHGCKIPGTHMFMRIPIEKHNEYTPVLDFSSEKRSIDLSSINLSLLKIKENNTEIDDFFSSLGKNYNTIISQAINKKIAIISIVSFGLEMLGFDSKSFSILFWELSLIAQTNHPLILFGLKNEIVRTAKEEWLYISHREKTNSFNPKRLNAHQSILLVSNDFSEIFTFGNENKNNAVKYTMNTSSKLNNEFTKEDLFKVFTDSLKRELARLLEESNCKYSNHYFLIEEKYYTQTYYEIGKFLKDTIVSNLVLNYYRIFLKINNIGAVITIAEPLFDLTDKLKREFPNIVFTSTNISSENFDIFKTHKKRENTKTLILTDVICLGNEINKVLRFENDPTQFLISTFVDARNEEFSYFIVKNADQPISIKVSSFIKKPIPPIFDLPSNVDYANVFIIDPKTRTPTSYDSSTQYRASNSYDFVTGEIQDSEVQIDKAELLKKIFSSRALIPGHVQFENKHYSNFIIFSRLFAELRTDIKKWLQSIFINMKIREKTNKSIALYYLEEDSGLINILVDFFSIYKNVKLKSITKENLNSPPAEIVNETSEQINWFILPVIASGETIQKCLEYSSRFSVESVYVSVVISRMFSQKLSFYLNISRYKNQKVVVSVFGRFPNQPHQIGDNCPLCIIEREISSIAKKLKNAPDLHKIILERKKLFELVDFSYKDIDKFDLIYPINIIQSETILIRLTYEDAQRSYQFKKDLSLLIDSASNIDGIMGIVGLEYYSEIFEKNNFKRIVYNRYLRIQNEVFGLIQNRPNELNVYILLGISRLFPNLLHKCFYRLINTSIKKNYISLFEDLVFITFFNSKEYGKYFLGSFENLEIKDLAVSKILHQIQT